MSPYHLTLLPTNGSTNPLPFPSSQKDSPIPITPINKIPLPSSPIPNSAMDLPPSSAPKRPCRHPSPPLSVLLSTFLSSPDPPVALDISLSRLLDARHDDLDKDRLLDSVMLLATLLRDAANRAQRRRAAKHNSLIWHLPHDLTVKVFSMLDTRSLCHAGATCSMFNNCAIDPLCYANVDLTANAPKINNAVVSTMIQRAGKNLRSLRLGIWPTSTFMPEFARPVSYTRNSIDSSGPSWNERRPRQGNESSVLTRSCLLALSVDGGAAGALLRRLHLYNIDKMDSSALCSALSACQSLVDLEVIGLHIELKRTLDSVSTYCRLVERLFLESSETGRDDSLKPSTCVDLVNGCSNLTSLALRGFKLHDHKVRTLVKGFERLKYVDLSTSYSITGTFLRNLGTSANTIEVLNLRDCLHLKEVEVAGFLSALLSGGCKLLRYLDISNKDGLSAEGDWNDRCYNPGIPVSKVSEARPEICLLAEFPHEGRFIESDHMSDSEISSGDSLQMIPAQEIGPYFASSSNSSYSSDQGSGNEDFHDINYQVYDDSIFNDANIYEEMGG